MNKFSKTSYSRHFNHENFMNSSHQANQHKIENDEMDHSKNKVRFHEGDNSKPLHGLIERKIEIDPTLLLTSKPHQWQGRTMKGEKSQVGNRELSSTVNDGFMKKVRERPESKKESRIKIMENLSLSKRKEDTIQRPQTSKGQRNVVYNRETRKTLNNEDEHEIEVRRETKTSFGTRRRNTSKQLELKTSIDPEFLALFAS